MVAESGRSGQNDGRGFDGNWLNYNYGQVASQPTPFLTPEQYLEIERGAAFRSEYIGGQMFAMSGGSFNHARIIRNVLVQLDGALSGRSCEAVGGDLRLYSERFGIYVYPDVVVACGPAKMLDQHKDTITDATAIVEVLSPSTSNYDRGEKFRFYRSLASFSEYLLLAQDFVGAEHHLRQADGSWIFREYALPDDDLELKSIGCRLVLGKLYDRVKFEP